MTVHIPVYLDPEPRSVSSICPGQVALYFQFVILVSFMCRFHNGVKCTENVFGLLHTSTNLLLSLSCQTKITLNPKEPCLARRISELFAINCHLKK